MKQIIYLAIICCIFFCCCKKEDNNDSTKIFYNEYQTPLVLDKNGTLKIDVDNDKKYDFKFQMDSSVNGTQTNYGLFITYISDAFSFSKGIMPLSGSYHIINKGDTINSNLTWLQLLPLSGFVNGVYYGEDFAYLGFKKKDNNVEYYGWLRIEKTDRTLKLFEMYYCKDTKLVVKAGIVSKE